VVERLAGQGEMMSRGEMPADVIGEVEPATQTWVAEQPEGVSDDVVDETTLDTPGEDMHPQGAVEQTLELEAEPETQAERDAPSLPAIEFELEGADLPLPELVEESAPDALPELPDEVAEPVALEAEEPTDAVETVETFEPADTAPLAAE